MSLQICKTVLFVLVPLLTVGQKRIPTEISRHKAVNSKFEKIVLFTESKNIDASEYNKVLKDVTFATLDLNETDRIVKNKYQTIEIQIPYNNTVLTIELYKVNPFSDNLKIITDKKESINYEKGCYYRGIINGNATSVASFNFFKSEVNGIVSSLEVGNLNIGRLLKKSTRQDYVIYSENDLLHRDEFVCNTSEGNTSEGNTPVNTVVTNRSVFTNKVVTTYIEVGYQAFLANSSDILETTNWITSIFNNSQALFENDGISITLKTIFIWTEDDFYSTSSSFILPAFINIRPNFDGDVGYVADIDPEQLGAQAFGIARLCDDRKYAYGDMAFSYEDIPVFSQPVYVLTHELGHVLGSHHTHACVWNGDNTALDGCAPAYGGCHTPETNPNMPGTLMSYCFPNFALGFGEQPANAIIQHINNSTCLGTDGSYSCINTIGIINILDVTQNNAFIDWIDANENNSKWDISVVPAGTPPLWKTIFTSSFQVEDLTPNTYYEVTIRGNCTEELKYPRHSIIFATQADNCAGAIIYDTGGATAGYGGNEHIIRTLVPTISNKKIKLTFNNLNLVPWEGWLFIYDGLNTNGPLLNYLTFGNPFFAYGFGSSFTPSGNTFTAQGQSGALTLEFFSSPFYSFTSLPSFNGGWKATISCISTLGNDEMGDGFIDYSYSPNPVKDLLSIKSKDMIKEVKIYSIDGKLLTAQLINETNASVDFSGLTIGNYIAKLYFEEGDASFKIVKK